MAYTSPSPTNVAANGNLTTWWIPATNLSGVAVTNVSVQVTVLPNNGLAPVTYIAYRGVFNFTTGVWQVGTLAAGETVWLKIVTSVADIGLAPFTITSVISGDGVDSNNVNNTLVQTLTSVSCDPTAGAVADPNSCNCVDVSLNDTPCTHGVTEYRITELSVTNSTVYTWDVETGQGHFTHTDPTVDITFTYSIWCDGGDGFVQASGPALVTIPAIIEDLTVFDHSADFIEGSTLTAPQIALLKAQPAYSGLTDEQIQAYCWEALYNADGDLVGGWAHDCTGEQDSRHFVFCSAEPCDNTPNPCPSCPYSDMPVDASDYLAGITNYTAEEGDILTIYHTDATAIWEYNGTAWVRSDCGCMWKISQDVDNAITLGSDNAPFLDVSTLPALNPYPVSFTITGTDTKTATITLSDATVLTTNFTDIDTNTTYTLVLALMGETYYIRLVNQLGNIVSSIALPDFSGACCCDCSFNLIPTVDGAVAETNCTIDWNVDAVWEARPISGDEGDWVALDGGFHNGEYTNGAADSYIRVRYTVNECEQISNIVTPTVDVVSASNVGGFAEVFKAKVGLDLQFRTFTGEGITVTENANDITLSVDCNCQRSLYWDPGTAEVYLLQSGDCSRETGTHEWETVSPSGVVATPPTITQVAVGGTSYTVLVGLGTGIGIRIKYVEDGCTKYTEIVTEPYTFTP